MSSLSQHRQQHISRTACTGNLTKMEFSETEVITGDLISRFEKVVQRFPEKIALKSPRSELTFLELDNWSNGIALKLLERQKPGDRVGLLFSHGVKSMVAQVAALKGGFTRTELNVSYPGARLREIIQHCQIRCILSRTEFRDLAEELASEQGISILYVDEAEPSALQKPGVVLAPRTPSSISFSSGSTGKPKLKEKNHLIELHSVMRVSQSIGLLPQDRMLFTRSATVIPFHALLTGACYYPADIQREGDLVDLVNWVRDEQITILRSPVSIFRAMMHTIPEGETLPSLSRIVLQGEPVYRADVEAYRKRFNEQCVMVSTLGVSEYGDFAHYFLDKQSPMDHATVPGGYPLQGVNVRLFKGADLPEDSAGEIGISGPFMESMSSLPERYMAQKNQDGSESIYYLTGDLGEIAPDGCVFHRGRKDFQVKIRGNRVNLLEVEAALLEIDGVSQAAAVARNKEHEVILVGYLEGREKDSKAVRHALEGKIPAAMIPSRFVFMDSLPRTLTGKIDRRSLPLPEDDHSSISETEIDASELTETDIQILEIWKDVLVIDRIGINDHFLDLGGDSLKAMMVLGRLNQHFEIKLRLRDLFDAPTVSQIAELIQPLLNPGSP